MAHSFSTTLQLPAQLVLPLELHDNIPFLWGILDGRPSLLLLDSGAPNITLNATHIPEHMLASGGELLGATGKVKSYRTKFSHLRFGEWSMGPMEVMALDETHLEEAFGLQYAGLIGFRQLVHYDWMVDYQAMELHLWANFHKEDHQISQELRVRYANHLPVVNTHIGGHEFQLLLDTGASGLVFDKDKRALLDHVVVAGETDDLQGAGGKKVPVTGGQLDKFQVGTKVFEGAEIKFADLSALQKRLGPFDGIIGYPMLGKARIVVSWEQKRLFFLED